MSADFLLTERLEPPRGAGAIGPESGARAELDQLWARGRAFLGAELAVMGGAMTWVSERNLVAAISNSGGFGVVASGSMSPGQLDGEIAATAALTDRPFGVNLITMHPQLNELIDVCLAHGIGHVVLAGGIPTGAAIARIRDGGAKVICFAPAPVIARKLVRAGANAIVIEGSEAGGHIGPVSTAVLAQEVLPVITEVPVFVAGGIGRGEAILSYLEMGAAGVQLGTRFVCAHESIAHPNFKRAFIRAAARDAVASVQLDARFPVIPVRALANPATERFAAMQRSIVERFSRGELSQKEAQLEIEHFWAGALRRAVIDGDVESGSLMAGQSVGMVTREQSTAEILDELVDQAVAAIAGRGACGRSGEPGPRRMNEAAGNSPANPPGISAGSAPAAPSATTGPTAGTRRLLRRLRDVMAATGTAQERLDRIVQIVAAEMVAEVCSAYVRRAGEVLELFATEGLRREAVHRTRLRIGEGLVGVIAATARPLALADAQTHPDFAYRPETGEEIYHSLMGVPILRGGRVLGVLVVQNRTLRHYTEDEIEIAQTIAMIVAELIAGGELVNPAELAQSDSGALLPLRLAGVRLNEGLAVAPAVLHEPKLLIRQVVAEDAEAELQRLHRAVAAMQTAIDEMVVTTRGLGAGEHREIIETYRMFAADRGWLDRITEAVRSGLTAEAAVEKISEENRTRMLQVADPYLRERLYDLEDLAHRLQRFLSGRGLSADAGDLPAEFILVARSMGPAELLDYAHRRIRGLVLEEGSPTAHVAIVARAFEIPVVGRVEDATGRTEPGDIVVVDGDRGQVLIRPSEDIHQSVLSSVGERQQRRAFYQTLGKAPAVTRDGVTIRLLLNAGLLIDLVQLGPTGAEGVGLFRTEIPLLTRDAFPDVADQTGFYRRAYEQAGGRPIVFRTLDIGGDKVLPYLTHTAEDNPAMGWRAIRIGLDRPAMLRQQLRALLRAAAGRDLWVKFPMIAEVAELERARALLDRECEQAALEGREPPRSIKVGVMLEVPSLLWQLPALLKRIDFLSIGTNDLAQFLFACDRGNPRLADRYDLLSAPMVALLREVVAKCTAAGIPLSMCGEMAGNPIEAMMLIGLGFRTLSVTSSAIGPLKAMLRSLDVAALSAYLGAIGDRPDHSLRGRLEAYAHDHDVAL